MNTFRIFLLLAALICPFGTYAQTAVDPDHADDGKASYYAKKFQGRKTANGEFFNNYDYTAAHRTLPFNTYLNVVNKENNYNIIVRVNDRGPYAKNRIIDLSEAAARRLGGYHHGVVVVKIEVLNLLQLTPEIEKTYHAAQVVDCLGNVAELSGISLSLWSTYDLIHAIYVANDLYLKENVDQVLIGTKEVAGKKKYHIIISCIDSKAAAVRLKSSYENKGFMKVIYFTP